MFFVQKTKDFLSLEIEDGRIKVQINLGGSSKAKILTKRTYNDGKKYVVEIRRTMLNGKTGQN